MTGSAASGIAKTHGTRGRTANTNHRPQYPGLLQAPRLSEIYDQNLYQANLEAI